MAGTMKGAARISPERIELKRTERAVRFLLTGGTGFLGSHIAVALLRAGFRVALLARSDKDHPAEERVRKILDWFGLAENERRRLKVVEGDITRPGLGTDREALKDMLRETDEIIHCASNTSFSERKRAEVEAVNCGGVLNVLDFARESGAYFFHHLSTAFAAGRTEGLCPEELVEPGGFWNAYEETKCRAEHSAVAACREAGIGLTIYRPSIVYGDSQTGRTRLFNAVYFPVRTALFIKETYEKDIRERGGRKAAEMGVWVEADGSTHLPLRIQVARDGGLDLIPVNYFTAAFLALMERAPGGGVFHIVNSRPKRIEDIVDYSCRLFRMTGIRTCGPEELHEIPKNPFETLYDHCIEPYAPYMRDTREFETVKSRPLLKAKGIGCPELDYEIFARCMNYAVEAGWGSRLL
jgi:nucleoside-diphosphate-sugar epimerase